jgi:hypothetical protein
VERRTVPAHAGPGVLARQYEYREMCDGPDVIWALRANPSHFNIHTQACGLSSIHGETRWPQPTGAEQGAGADLSSSRRSAHDDALNAKSPTSCAKRSGASR